MDIFLEPMENYTFGRGVQKGSHGKYRWWFCQEENKLAPDFELSKMGVVVELTPETAMRLLKDQGDEAWNKIMREYPDVGLEMIVWDREEVI